MQENKLAGLPLLLVVSPRVHCRELRSTEDGAVFYRAQASLTALAFTDGGQDVEFSDIAARKSSR